MTLQIRLDDGLAELAQRILSGEITIVPNDQAIPRADMDTVIDLDGLLGLARHCDLHHFHVEAARIRRWVGDLKA